MIDSRVPNQALAGADDDFDVVGAQRTINVGPGIRTSDIVRMINRAIIGIAGSIKLDLICHGTAGHLNGSSEIIYRLQLGEPGIYNHPASLTPWVELSGHITKVRVMACGVLSDTISDRFTTPSAFDSQNALMRAFARTVGRTVKYTFETFWGDTEAGPLVRSYTPNRMERNVFEVTRDGVRTRLR